MKRFSAFIPELLLFGLAAVLLWFCANRFAVETSIAELLPRASQPASEIADHLLDSKLTRSMVLSIGPNRRVAKTAQAAELHQLKQDALKLAQDLAIQLRKHPRIEWVRSGPDPNFETALYETYFPRRHVLLAADAETLSERLSEPSLVRATERLKAELASASGLVLSKIAPADPLMSFAGLVNHFKETAGQGLQVVDGQFVASDGHAILLVGLLDSALDSQKQSQLLEHIDELFHKRVGEAPLQLERSGFNLFSADSQERIEADVNRVVAFSVLGVVLLFLFLFRSIRSLLLSSVPLAFGVLLGLSACLLGFGEIHSLTLAFGVSLMGVCIDYPVHVLNHRGLAPLNAGSTKVPPAVVRGLTLGAATTVVGISMLAFSGFNVMQQVAVFAAAGLLGSLAVALLYLPRWDRARPSPLRIRYAAQLLSLAHSMVRRPKWLAAGYTFALVAGVAGLALSRWSSTMESLMPMAPALKAEDARVLSRLGAPSKGQFVVVRGDTLEHALSRNEAVASKLEQAMAANNLDGFQSLSTFLLSSAAQQHNLQALRDPETQERIRTALAVADFDPTAFQPFFDSLSVPEAEQKLSFAQLSASPLGALVQRFVSEQQGRFLVVTFLPDAEISESLRRGLEQIPEAFLIQRKQLVDAAYTRLRDRTRWMVLAALFAMGATVWSRTRRPLRSLAVLSPAVAAPTFALGILGGFGQELNLFHIIAAIIVAGMALDYGIYTDESLADGPSDWTRAESPLGGALLSICIAASTTMLSFGPLGFSSIPVLQALGQTIGLGILAALLMVPVSIWWHSPKLTPERPPQ